MARGEARWLVEGLSTWAATLVKTTVTLTSRSSQTEGSVSHQSPLALSISKEEWRATWLGCRASLLGGGSRMQQMARGKATVHCTTALTAKAARHPNWLAMLAAVRVQILAPAPTAAKHIAMAVEVWS